jgi:hypothetical protein
MARLYALLTFVVFALALFCGLLPVASMAATTAASGAGVPPGGTPPGPPPEAIAACTGKTAGTQVSFVGRGGETLTGVCQLINGVLAARPVGGPPPPAR